LRSRSRKRIERSRVELLQGSFGAPAEDSRSCRRSLLGRASDGHASHGRPAVKRASACAALLVALSAASTSRAQQDLGHKKLGTLGIHAGAQSPPGLYVSNQFLWYSADDLVDRSGQRLEAAFTSRALQGTFGAKAVFLLPVLRTHLGVGFSVPAARLDV